MKKVYALTFRTIQNERFEVNVEGESLEAIAKEIRGTQLTFIANRDPNFKSFSIFTSNILRVDYRLLKVSPFDNVSIVRILALD